MTDEKIAALMAAVSELKDKKVTAIKVELEAHMSRNWDEADCYNWLMERIAEKTGTEYIGSEIDSYDDIEETNPFSWMKFAKFYNDGSVDSELTFTVPIDNPNNVTHLPAVIEAFKELSGVAGSRFEVQGAGMHMAVLFSKNSGYPSEADNYRKSENPYSRRLHPVKIANFKRAVTQLLPALYFLASCNDSSRGLRFRIPYVSMDYRADSSPSGNNKYCAISYRHGAIEFRVFDTCYDTPDTVFDNLIVMANCMKYLTMQYESPGIDKLCSSLTFGTDNNNTLARFYTTISHLDVLEAGLDKLKPSYYTLDQVKDQRKFLTNREGLRNMERDAQVEAKRLYEEYCERFEWEVKRFESQLRFSLTDKALQSKTLVQLRDLQYSDLELEVKDQIRREVDSYKATKTPEDSYIQTAVQRVLNRNQPGRYELTFA